LATGNIKYKEKTMHFGRRAFPVMSCALAVMAMAPAARADLLSGSAWLNVNGWFAAKPLPGGTPTATFTTNSVNFNTPSPFTLGALLTAIGANVITDTNSSGILSTGNCVNSGSCPGALLDFTGNANLVNGTIYNITHDDGVSLYLDGSAVAVPGFTATPVSQTTEHFTFGGTTGVHSFELVYTEVNGAPAVLSTDLQFVPDGGMTLMLLGGALVGLETLRRKFRV
jgi:hypothetical protein